MGSWSAWSSPSPGARPQGRGYQSRKQGRKQGRKLTHIYNDQVRKHIRRARPQAFSFFFLNNDQVRKLKKKNKQGRKLSPPPQLKPFKFPPYIQGAEGRRGGRYYPQYINSFIKCFIICFIICFNLYY